MNLKTMEDSRTPTSSLDFICLNEIKIVKRFFYFLKLLYYRIMSFKFYLCVFIRFSFVNLETVRSHIDGLTVHSSRVYLKRVFTLFEKEEKIYSLILSNFLCDIDRDTDIAISLRVTANRVCCCHHSKKIVIS